MKCQYLLYTPITAVLSETHIEHYTADALQIRVSLIQGHDVPSSLTRLHFGGLHLPPERAKLPKGESSKVFGTSTFTNSCFMKVVTYLICWCTKFLVHIVIFFRFIQYKFSGWLFVRLIWSDTLNFIVNFRVEQWCSVNFKVCLIIFFFRRLLKTILQCAYNFFSNISWRYKLFSVEVSCSRLMRTSDHYVDVFMRICLHCFMSWLLICSS